MIELGKTIIAQSILDRTFVCNLTACKGACCEEGDAGAPLEADEVLQIQKDLKNILPYLPKENQESIANNGFYYYDDDLEPVTGLINNKACVFAVKNSKNEWQCAIETAHNDGNSETQKPISCHLYPIRITKYKNFEALNYHQWDICSPACSLGEKLKIPIYKFLKAPLIRKYGKEWYETLVNIADSVQKRES